MSSWPKMKKGTKECGDVGVSIIFTSAHDGH